MGCRGRARHRDPVHAGPRRDAGLHRRSLHRRPRHHARGGRRPRRRRRRKINPLSPAEMVIDHSVIADLFGTENALERNVEIEYERNGERYQFLRWGQTAFDDFKVVPPGTGIVHQVNIEHLAKVIYDRTVGGVAARLPRHLRRHRLAHHDGQRPRRARLGRRRHRGRGRDARPARVDAHPQGRRLQALGRDPDRRHRDRRRADDHRHAAQARRRRQVRRVLRRGRGLRPAREPRDHRQHEPGVRLDRRDVPDRQRDRRLPAPHRPRRAAARAGRGVREGADALARRLARAGLQRVHGARPLDGRPVDRRPEAPAGPHRALAGEAAVRERPHRTTPRSTTIWSISRARSRSRHPTRPETRPRTSTATTSTTTTATRRRRRRSRPR